MMQALQAVRRTSTRRCLSAKPAVGHSGHLSADSLKNQHDAPDLGLAMSHKHKYLFDLNGYLVLRGVFSPDDVAAANAAERDADTHHERTGQLRTSGLYGRESHALAGDGARGRLDMGGLLAWDAPHNAVFRSMLNHPALAGDDGAHGRGLPLDHSPLLLGMEKGSEGHTLHGGAITEAGEPAWPLRYECVGRQMRNQLLTACLQLTDAPAGAGGFCAVPGSHKANFSIPPALADLADDELGRDAAQPPIMAGTPSSARRRSTARCPGRWTTSAARSSTASRPRAPRTAATRRGPAAMLAGMSGRSARSARRPTTRA
ncbi:phytanoyl-CoA dioxygenase [Aureococcus anophagefferens]|nr:phytanoyl-CoA dioxygenase [Aureococcus anophagefferens]